MIRLTALLVLLAASADADTYPARALCATETANASNLMMLRQRGATRQALQNIALSVGPSAQPVYLGMVQEAFQHPRLDALQAQRVEAYRFGQEWGARCRQRVGI